MSLAWEQVIIAAADPSALGRWWTEALGWVVVDDSAETFEIRPSEDEIPGLLFLQVADAKAAKNRLHLDVRIGDADREQEVARLTGLGATELWRGRQGPHVWVTMADPEGNEFCVA